VLKVLGSQSGLAAVSETSGDIRDILEGIAHGCPKAKLALELYVTAVRDYIGAYLVELGGADAIVFTGGIGQAQPRRCERESAKAWSLRASNLTNRRTPRRRQRGNAHRGGGLKDGLVGHADQRRTDRGRGRQWNF